MFRAARKLAPLSLCAAAATGAYLWNSSRMRQPPMVVTHCAAAHAAGSLPREALDAAANRTVNATHAPYVIIGAGTTAHAAIEVLHQKDPAAQV